jgi:metallophosphoesterase (TIGR00282 family)
MKALIFADVVARPGRRALIDSLPILRERYSPDIVMMNAENVAGGISITPELADELFAAGIDVMTSGNHIFDKHEIVAYIERNPRLLRPANYPPGTPGRGFFVGEINGHRIAVINLMGRLFMQTCDDPFRAVEQCLAEIPKDVKTIFVDVHCEATSEKYALGWFLDGRVSAVYGSHTHVPTADERILEKGTAYITDVGMTGSYAGVIGMEREGVIKRFTSHPNPKAGQAKGQLWACAIVVEIDDESGRAKSIERIRHELDGE